jgi:hypothetical protein
VWRKSAVNARSNNANLSHYTLSDKFKVGLYSVSTYNTHKSEAE